MNSSNFFLALFTLKPVIVRQHLYYFNFIIKSSSKSYRIQIIDVYIIYLTENVDAKIMNKMKSCYSEMLIDRMLNVKCEKIYNI